MRKFLFVLLLSPVFANAQGWLWARPSVGTEAHAATGVAADRAGNVYATGHTIKNYMTDTGNSIFFGPLSIISTENAYTWLVKYDAAGTPLWLKKIPYSSRSSVATDAAGNVFLAGSYTGPFVLGAVTLTPPDMVASNVYVAKMDSAGTVLWVASGTGVGATGGTATAVAADSVGNVTVAGRISRSITFGSQVLDTNDLFLVRYNADGVQQWARSLGGHAQYDSISSGILFPEHLSGITTDAFGNIVVSGWYTSDTFSAGSHRLVNLSGGAYNGYVIKYDTAGNALWAHTMGGASSTAGQVNDYPNAVAVDAAGDVYIAGTTNADELHIGGNVYPNACHCYEQLLAKYTADGTFRWFHTSVFPVAGAGNGSMAHALVSGNGRSIYMQGIVTNQADFGGHILADCNYLVQMDTAGNYTTAAVLSNLNWAIPASVTADTGGNAFVLGQYLANTTVGDTSLELSGAMNVFLVKYGPAGTPTEPESIVGPTKEMLLNIFPNPATEQLNIQANAGIRTVSISTITGRQVFSATCAADQVSVNITGLTPGTYLLKVNGTVVRRFVKE